MIHSSWAHPMLIGVLLLSPLLLLACRNTDSPAAAGGTTFRVIETSADSTKDATHSTPPDATKDSTKDATHSTPPDATKDSTKDATHSTPPDATKDSSKDASNNAFSWVPPAGTPGEGPSFFFYNRTGANVIFRFNGAHTLVTEIECLEVSGKKDIVYGVAPIGVRDVTLSPLPPAFKYNCWSRYRNAVGWGKASAIFVLEQAN